MTAKKVAVRAGGSQKAEAPKKVKDGPEKQSEAWSSFKLSKAKEFAGEVRTEFGKIVWPDKKVTFGATGVVIVLVFIISLYLGAVDLFIGKLVSYILK